MPRSAEEIAFAPDAPQAVVALMDRLGSARDGWINLLPGVPEDEAQAHRRQGSSVFGALFGTVQPPVSMATWFPPRGGRRPSEEQTVGIMHPKGAGAVAQLAQAGSPVPAACRVAQDHPRRGLIVHPPGSMPHDAVLGWALQATAALAAAPLTGTWKAVVYLPLG